MAKPSYQNVTIAPIADVPVPMPAAPPNHSRKTLREVASQVVLYLHPAAAKTLKHYAVEQGVKVHDLLIEALEDWFTKHGLRGPVRAKASESAVAGRGGTFTQDTPGTSV